MSSAQVALLTHTTKGGEIKESLFYYFITKSKVGVVLALLRVKNAGKLSTMKMVML